MGRRGDNGVVTASDENAVERPRRRAEDVYDEMVGMESRIGVQLDELRKCIPHTVAEEVQETLASGNFTLPDGSRPMDLLTDHHRFDEEQHKLSESVQRIITTLDGPTRVDLAGISRVDYTKGMAYKVGQLYEGVNGGRGIKVQRKWSPGQYVLVAAGVTSLATIAGALISGLL